MPERTVDFAFHAEMVRYADPVMPKFDLALENNELKLARNFEEIPQSLLLRVLMQRGDYRYDRRMGLPWIDHPKAGNVIPIMGSLMEPHNLKRIEVLVMREVFKNFKVKRVDKVVATPQDPLRRRISVEVHCTTFDDQLVKLYFELYGDQ